MKDGINFLITTDVKNIIRYNLQVGGRAVIFFCLIEGEERMQTKPVIFYLFLVWSSIELVRSVSSGTVFTSSIDPVELACTVDSTLCALWQVHLYLHIKVCHTVSVHIMCKTL